MRTSKMEVKRKPAKKLIKIKKIVFKNKATNNKSQLKKIHWKKKTNKMN